VQVVAARSSWAEGNCSCDLVAKFRCRWNISRARVVIVLSESVGHDVRILGLCGSLQASSKNLALLKVSATSVPPGVELVIFTGLSDLPHFNPDIELNGVPESVLRWRQALAECDAVLVASPEYGFSLPGVLKNGIDWVIGSGELEEKVVAITAAVPAPNRGRRGLQALGDTLSAVRASVVGGDPILLGPEFDARVGALVRTLIASAMADRRRRDSVTDPQFGG